MSSGDSATIRSTRVDFSCGNAHLAAALPSERAAAWLNTLLPEHRTSATLEPTEMQPHSAVDFSIEQTSEGWFVLDHGLLPAVRGPIGEGQAWGVLERALADRLALGLVSSLEPAVLVHAGGVAADGGAVLIAGVSGSGKSSLVTAFASTSFSVLGDDAVVLTTDGRVHPFHRPFKLHEGARRQLGLARPASEAVGAGADPWLYQPEELGSKWSDPAPLRDVIFARREPGTDARLTEELPAVGTRLLLDLGLGPVDRTHALSRIIDGTQGARFWALRFDRCDLAREVVAGQLGLEV